VEANSMDVTPPTGLLAVAVVNAGELGRYLRGQVSNTWDAEDLLQELYVAALKVRSPELIRAPKAYVFTMASHLVVQYRERANARPPHICLDDLPVEALHAASPNRYAGTPESDAALHERWYLFTQKLSELSPKIQAAVIWHHRDGYTCEEIAERLAIVRNRVKKHLTKGLAHCRRVTTAVEGRA
jgi:RNA polymerase sigma-70 factor (ECF subfamily)